jgi:hypothetical protein
VDQQIDEGSFRLRRLSSKNAKIGTASLSDTPGGDEVSRLRPAERSPAGAPPHRRFIAIALGSIDMAISGRKAVDSLSGDGLEIMVPSPMPGILAPFASTMFTILLLLDLQPAAAPERNCWPEGRAVP